MNARMRGKVSSRALLQYFIQDQTNKVHPQTLLNLSLSGEFVATVWLEDEAG